MRYGFINVATASPAVKVADVRSNLLSAKETVTAADSAGIELLVLPELHLTAYTCGDLFYSELLTSSALEALVELRDHSAGKRPVIVVGCPIASCGKLYNCAAVIQGGEILGIVPKSYLPNYGEFYEQRQFCSGSAYSGPDTIDIGGRRVAFGCDLLFCSREMDSFVLGVEICEDLWAPVTPSTALCLSGATIIANPSASDELIGKEEYRRQLVSAASARLICAYAYSNAGVGESTQDMVFSGHSMICENGQVLAERAPFAKGDAMLSTQVDLFRLSSERRRNTSFEPRGTARRIWFSQPLRETVLTRCIARRPFVPDDGRTLSERAEAILQMQSFGLAGRLRHIGCKTAVLGISGGLDSTLALLATVRAFEILDKDRRDILCVTMPCFGTSDRTLKNATALCGLLGVSFRCVDITEAVELHFKDIGHDAAQADTTFENCQARERTQVLMDIANQSGGIVVGTGDLSELALGWATYNGDHMSMYAVNCSVPKTLVRYIISYEAASQRDALRAVLEDILATPVSPELLPDSGKGISQRTEDIIGPYELHDFFLYHMLRTGARPTRVFHLAQYAFSGEYSDAEILKWLRVFASRFFAQQYKRSCLPDGPKVGTVTLSPRGDWRMPSDASASLWLSEIDELGITGSELWQKAIAAGELGCLKAIQRGSAEETLQS